MRPKPTERTTAGIVMASEFTANGIIPCEPSAPPPVKRTSRKFARVNDGLVNAVHHPVERIASLSRKEVTTSPIVGMVHSSAITETTIDAIGDVNGRLWCATKGLFGLAIFAILVLPFCAQ